MLLGFGRNVPRWLARSAWTSGTTDSPVRGYLRTSSFGGGVTIEVYSLQYLLKSLNCDTAI